MGKIVCGCDCHLNPLVCVGFHICCNEINVPRQNLRDLTNDPPRKKPEVARFFKKPRFIAKVPKINTFDFFRHQPMQFEENSYEHLKFLAGIICPWEKNWEKKK